MQTVECLCSTISANSSFDFICIVKRWMALSKPASTREKAVKRFFVSETVLTSFVVKNRYEWDMRLSLDSVGPDAELGFLQLTVSPGFFYCNLGPPFQLFLPVSQRQPRGGNAHHLHTACKVAFHNQGLEWATVKFADTNHSEGLCSWHKLFFLCIKLFAGIFRIEVHHSLVAIKGAMMQLMSATLAQLNLCT